MSTEILCPYCQAPAVFVDSAEIYGGRSYGMIWLCRPCNAYVGCHRPGKGNVPLGRLADAQLRSWKQRAHRAFDPLWKSRKMSRGAAYKWLAEKMELPVEKCHIGMFDVGDCQRVIQTCLGV